MWMQGAAESMWPLASKSLEATKPKAPRPSSSRARPGPQAERKRNEAGTLKKFPPVFKNGLIRMTAGATKGPKSSSKRVRCDGSTDSGFLGLCLLWLDGTEHPKDAKVRPAHAKLRSTANACRHCTPRSTLSLEDPLQILHRSSSLCRFIGP